MPYTIKGAIIKKKIYFFIVFIVFEVVILSLLTANSNSKKEQILEASKTLVNIQFNTIYNAFDSLAKTVFKGYINKEEILQAVASGNREKLYSLLKEDYSYLKSVDFEQIHFHTPMNHSFLRMHQPDRFGDDLTDIRYSIKYVNEFKQPITGLEMGRIVPGFRYVYPLFDKNNTHIGSVETSFNVKSFSNKVEQVYDVHTHFLITKELFESKIFDTYKPYFSASIESDEFILLNRNSDESVKHEEMYLKALFQHRLKKEISDKMKAYKTFSLDINIRTKSMNKYKIATFLPLQDIQKHNIGYYVVYQDSKALLKLHKEFYNSLIIFTLINLLIVFLMHKSYTNKAILKRAVEEQTKQLNQKNRELQELNSSLEERIQEEVNKIKEQELKLFEAEKMAQMGEMISNIAHQWRQPLNTISIYASGVKLSYEMEINSSEHSCSYMDTILKNTEYLSHTIDVFRDFINQKGEYKEVILQNVMNNALRILRDSLKNNHIALKTNFDTLEPLPLKTIAKDLAQVMVNILTNSKDILKHRNIKEPWINVELKKEDEFCLITVEDNAGGIVDEQISKIFDPYFTTKHKSVGTGLGLYISKKIVLESLLGKIYVKNSVHGAKFFIELPWTIKTKEALV